MNSNSSYHEIDGIINTWANRNSLKNHYSISRSRMSMCVSLLLSSIFLIGCGLFDSRIEWKSGSYALLWIDTPNNVSLSYDLGNDGWAERIAPQVFAIGGDETYIVAKQHPNGNKTITNFFIILRNEDSPTADAKRAVIGPLTATAFAQKEIELNLPDFSKVLESLQ